MAKFKKPLLFALAMLLVGLVGGFFTALYQFYLYGEATMAEAISQVGSVEAVLAISAAQSAIYAAVCAFFGYIMAEKLGLWRPIKFEKAQTIKTAALAAALGIVFALDYWTFGKLIPQLAGSYDAGLSVNAFISSVLYGGIIEEIMLRLFFLSLIALVIWKLFFRKHEAVPAGVLVAANIIAAIAFAAGHLPATVVAFGELTPLLLVRCFLLNGGFGFAFGWLYLRRGVHHAMLAHAICHIVSKVIWLIFI